MIKNKLSLQETHPKVAGQWHPTKNGDLTPDQVVVGSRKKVWWKCDKGPDHEWDATSSNRTRGRNCPCCSGRKVSVTNSLSSLYPEIAKEWHPDKNGDLKPNQVVAGSHRKVWWKCDKGPDHEWDSAVLNRTDRGSGCPCCSGLKVSVTNSLASLYPEIAKEWHPDKNGDLKPDQVVAGSNKKFWWRCDKGIDHEWDATSNNRTIGGNGCPCCRGKKVSVTNSLASLYPELAKEWHPNKNGDLKPNQVVAGSGKKAWWKCDKGPDHEWDAIPNSRTGMGTDCPFCAGKKVSVTNSLASLHPELAKEWHPDKNGDLKPDQVVAGSTKKVWWKCDKGPDHEWDATLVNRTRGRNCPYCRGLKVSVTNSLASLYPEIAKEWHPDKNGDLKPDQLTYGSDQKVWWKCDKGPDHEWNSAVSNRTSGGGHGCSFCDGKRVSVTNSLSSLYPELAKEWHPDKNGDLKPDQVVAGSNKKFWWKCDKGPDHEWDATSNNRTNAGIGCPYCHVSPRSKIELQLAHEILFFLDFSVDDIDVVIDDDTRQLQVDIKIPDLDLIIEYDGSYWHEGNEKKERDKNKTGLLTEHGWKVIRVRLEDQGSITDDDILLNADDMNSVKTVAEHVLCKLSELGHIDHGTSKDYKNRKDLINAKQAEQYIEKLLKEKNVEDPQFEFSF